MLIPPNQAVRAGAAYLDKEHPGWRGVVNPHMLHIDDPYRCILGQIQQAYGDGGGYYKYIATHPNCTYEWGLCHGFLVDCNDAGLSELLDKGVVAQAIRQATVALTARWIVELVGAQLPEKEQEDGITAN